MFRQQMSCSDVHPKKHVCSKQRTIIQFRDWHEYIDYVEVQLQAVNNKFTATMPSTRKTIKLARTGDPKSAEKLTHYRKVIFDKVSEHLKSLEIVADVTGGAFDIAELLAGIPTCCRHFAVSDNSQNVKIVFSPEVHVDSNSDALFIRGAAMLALIDALEKSNRRVELWMGFDTLTSLGHYESQVCIKRQGESVNATDLVFPACDEDFLKVLEFAILRSEWEKTVEFGRMGHNSGMSLSGDIVVDGNHQDGHMWSNVERCQTWILELLAKSGVQIENTEVKS